MRVGVVSYLNTLPLIDGLDGLVGLGGLELRHTVPSLLIDHLVAGDVDVALCSSIDYQSTATPLTIVPVGMLGCAGPTLTVRLSSVRPPAEIETVHVDSDSHTSVALLQVVLAERHGIRPGIVPFDAREGTVGSRLVDPPDAMLLIGDKVVTAAPPDGRYAHQLDLGAEWFDLTGLPFVFAIWMARSDADPRTVADIATILDRQRRHNRERIGRIVTRRATPRGWPEELARHYLTHCLRYDFDEAAQRGLELFWSRVHALGLIAAVRPTALAPVVALAER